MDENRSSRTHASGQHAAPPSVARAINERAVYLTTAVVFAAAAWFTYTYARSMAEGMPMPGNWKMSMMWMVMQGQTQLTAALEFAGMWLAMMVAMMLPSSLPILLTYRRAAAFRGEKALGLSTSLVAGGYFAVWSAFGLGAYALGMLIAGAAMRSPTVSRLVPVASGAALVVAGIYQLTPLKLACLKHCRDPLLIIAQHLHGGWSGALGLGFHHGAFCAACCWALMLIQLTLGVMNLAVMIAVAALIALEKLLVRGEMVARLTGGLAIGGGIFLAAQAVF